MVHPPNRQESRKRNGIAAVLIDHEAAQESHERNGIASEEAETRARLQSRRTAEILHPDRMKQAAALRQQRHRLAAVLIDHEAAQRRAYADLEDARFELMQERFAGVRRDHEQRLVLQRHRLAAVLNLQAALRCAEVRPEHLSFAPMLEPTAGRRTAEGAEANLRRAHAEIVKYLQRAEEGGDAASAAPVPRTASAGHDPHHHHPLSWNASFVAPCAEGPSSEPTPRNSGGGDSPPAPQRKTQPSVPPVEE